MDKPHSTVGSRTVGISETWLAKTREPILEPALAIIRHLPDSFRSLVA
jgi:hypothetical protein